MNALRLCYIAMSPLMTYNALYYSISTLSTSISSSQTVCRFILEHKECDTDIFKSEIETKDLLHKLKIAESLINDIVKRYSSTEHEYKEFHNIVYGNGQDIITDTEFNEYSIVDVNQNLNILISMPEPLKLSLISTCITIENINETIQEIYLKIKTYESSYVKKMVSLSLKPELSKLNKQINLFDTRLDTLFEILKIYGKYH